MNRSYKYVDWWWRWRTFCGCPVLVEEEEEEEEEAADRGGLYTSNRKVIKVNIK